MGNERGAHAFQRRQLGLDALAHGVGERLHQAVAEEDAEEGADQRRGHMGADFRDAAANAAHGDDDPHDRRENAETRHRLADLVQRTRRLQQGVLHGFELLLEEALQFVRGDLAHRHQTEVVGDEGHQVLFLKDQRIAHEQVALLRLFDVRVEYLEAADIDHFQQLVEQHQQLALKLLATTLVGEHSLDLVQHLDQHFLGIADH